MFSNAKSRPKAAGRFHLVVVVSASFGGLMLKSQKLSGLDALRGVAILLVIVSHFSGAVIGSAAVIVFANAGVILFFFLSGFLMYWTLTIDPSVKNYAIRRAFRIMPIYWLSIILVAALQNNRDFAQILSNFSFTAPIFGQERMLGVYWTLYIEVLFYCFAPSIFFLGVRGVRFAPYAAFAFLAIIWATFGLGAGAPFYVTFCLCGMQVAAWHCGKLNGAEAILSTATASALFTLLVPLPLYLAAVPLVSAGMLYTALRLNARLLPLEWLGAVSYGWYLFHSIAGYGSPVIAAASLAAAAIAYWMVERPAIAIGKKITLSLRATSAVPALS